MYVPQLIFGNLLTSSSYNDNKKSNRRRNVFGEKLTNIYSKAFKVETADKETDKKYTQ